MKQEQTVEKIKYVVTDPCYLIPYETWQKLVDQAYNSNAPMRWKHKYFELLIEKELFDLTGKESWVSSTGYGDWFNKLHGKVLDNLRCDFTSDSGMVCVCKYLPIVEKCKEYCVAIFEAMGKINVEFDMSNKYWTIVKINDEAGNYWHSATEE